MEDFAKAFVVFLLVCALSAILGWLAGYDFDYRSPDVAFWALMTILFGGMFSFFYMAMRN